MQPQQCTRFKRKMRNRHGFKGRKAFNLSTSIMHTTPQIHREEVDLTTPTNCSFHFKVDLCHNTKRGSASYIVREVCLERERERERKRKRERERLAMSSHLPFPEIRTLCSASLTGQHCRAEIDERTLTVAKQLTSSFRPSEVVRQVTKEPKTNDHMHGCTIFFP